MGEGFVMKRAAWFIATLGVVMTGAAQSSAATRRVGPGQTYAAPCAAIAAAADGDVIEIDAAGTYRGDVCGWTKSLTIRGVGGRAHIQAAGAASGGKGTWVIGAPSTLIEDIELSGASVPDRNGAGIRFEGAGKLTLRRCFLHHNEDGILGGTKASEITIEYSELADNGFGDGQSHNLYVTAARFTLRGSFSHHAKVGHNVKSRAEENVIVGNRIGDEADGTASYEIDLPNGGRSFVIGNVIQQGPQSQNPTMLAYGEEGLTNASSELFVVNNTFVNDLGRGTFVGNGAATTPSVVRNNVFVGGGTLVAQATAILGGNFSSGDPMMVNRAGYDYHLLPGSPCVNAGVEPGIGAGAPLMPVVQYVHPAGLEGRTAVGAIDVGAFELGGGRGPIDGGAGGGVDGGSAVDSGSAGPSVDGGSDPLAAGPGGGEDGGCACGLVSPGSSRGALAVAVGVVVLALRRRRSHWVAR